MGDAKRDSNLVATLLGVSSVDGVTPVTLYVDPTTHRLLVSSSGPTEETPVGTVNGSNVTFTVSNTPKFVIIDGMFRVSGQGYTYSGGIITVDSLIPPVQFIRSFY